MIVELKPLVLNPPLNITFITKPEQLVPLYSFLERIQEVGFDIETNVTQEHFTRRVRSIQLGNQDEQYVIDLLAFCNNNSDLLIRCQGEYGKHLHLCPALESLLLELSLWLCSNKVLKLGVNLGFEFTSFYWNFGLRPWHFYGCDIVERVIGAGIVPLENFAYFSMEELMARYHGVQIDKTLQTSFTVDQPLTQAQIEYAALDTRLPFAIKNKQVWRLQHDPDNLWEIINIENNAIMSFEEMSVHGEKIDRARWIARIDKLIPLQAEALKKLDECLIPITGSIDDVVTDEMVEEATAKWKAIPLKDTERRPLRDKLKKEASDLGKLRTKHKKLLIDVQGRALFNYDSPTALLSLLKNCFGLELESTDDDDLKHHVGIPIIDALRDYREYTKQINTYGYAWAREWKTEPCNEQGWLSPYTGRLHSKFNQLAAETGRSSSDKPNGQNLPQDKECRSCFIADDGYVYITADMSGAELRIIAECANAKTWIEAFNRGEDVHSVGCEILFPKEWPEEQCCGEEVKIDGVLKPYWCEYYAKNEKGEPKRQKCECPKHKKRRNATKAINFLLAYGGVAATLAARIGVSFEEAEELMANHAAKFSDIHAYLEQSGKRALAYRRSFDMFGRRRLFAEPNEEAAKKKIIKYWHKQLLYPKDIQEKNIKEWMKQNNTDKRPIGDVKFWLTHRNPDAKLINSAKKSLRNSIERAGKNHTIQGTNATIAKVAMGAGNDKNGKPFLFHILPKYGAKLVKFVHDEFVVMCPKACAEQVAAEIGDAFKRAAAEKMTKVIMEFEYKIAPYWCK